MAMYEQVRTVVRTETANSESVEVKVSLHQGSGPESPAVLGRDGGSYSGSERGPAMGAAVC